MPGNKIFFALFLFSMAISGCMGDPTIIPGTIHHQLAISKGSFSPSVWRVPAGEMVTFVIDNRDDSQHDFTVFIRPINLPFSKEHESQVYFRHDLEPRQETTFSFQVPQAPGEFKVISTIPGDAEKGLIGALVVVRLDETLLD